MSIYDPSFFIAATAQSFDVVLPGDQKVTLWYREIPNWLSAWVHEISKSGDLEAKAKSYARLLSESLCGPNGEPALTYREALTLKPDHCFAIFLALTAANSSSAGEDSSSGQSDGSGTSSLSRSEKPSASSKLQ